MGNNKEIEKQNQQLSALVGRITGKLMGLPYLISEQQNKAHEVVKMLLIDIGRSMDSISYGDGAHPETNRSLLNYERFSKSPKTL